jgi:transposase, IS30 family
MPLTLCDATQHHSSQRGSNGNLNGLIWQYIPKGTSIEHLTKADCDRIADKLNHPVRKRYDCRIPKALHDAER